MKNPDLPPPFEDWLKNRVPSVPKAFLPHLLELEGRVGYQSDLTSMGLRALSRALGESGKNREGAFHLLSADALLTYACEVVAETEGDIRSGLAETLSRVGGMDR